MSSALVTSSWKGLSLALAWAWSASPSARLRTPAKTRKFNLSRARAQAAPIPVDAPVITTLPAEVVSAALTRSLKAYSRLRRVLLKPSMVSLPRTMRSKSELLT